MQSVTESRLPTLRQVAIVLVAVDLAVVALHIVTAGAELVNLDAEGNLPTWYSSAKLFIIALLAVAAWHLETTGNDSRKLRHSRLWIAVAGIFAALSLDETASIHERAARAWIGSGTAGGVRATLLGGDAAKDSFAWVVLFSPLAVGLLFFLAGFAWTRRETLRPVLPFGAAGLACYLLAMLLEPAAVYFTPPMESWDAALMSRYQLFALFEESAEIAGTTLLLVTVFAYVRAMIFTAER